MPGQAPDRLDALLDDLATRVATRLQGAAADDRVGLRPEEAAARLGVGKGTVQRLLRTGELPSFRVGRLRLVRPEDLRTYAAEQAKAEADRRTTGHPHGVPAALRRVVRRATGRDEEPAGSPD